MEDQVFPGMGSDISFVFDDKLPEDTNIVIKVKDDTVEFRVNPRRLFSSMNNKNIIVAGINKKLIQMIEEFKAKISFKRQEGSKYWDLMWKDIVYDRVKDNPAVKYHDAERVMEGALSILLEKKETEENRIIEENKKIDKIQADLDKEKK